MFPDTVSMKRPQKGFSLIELLIVVAIILIIAAIAIPNLLRSRMAANEASAVSSVRTINTAEVTYASTYGIGYAALASLRTPVGGCPGSIGTAAAACLVDEILGSGTKSGYTITATPSNGAGTMASPFVSFNTGAQPVALGLAGQRSFCSDESGVIRFDVTGAPPPATCGPSGLPTLQ